MLKKISLMVVLLFSIFINAENIDNIIENATVTKKFLIIKSTTNYSEAKEYAKKIAKKSDIKLDLRGLSFNEKIHLTFDERFCTDDGMGEYPCYLPRGRYDDGEYISIEHSSSYSGFTNGYYIVMVASGEDIQSSLEKIKKIVSDAYVKSDEVYMGCIHQCNEESENV